MAKKNTAPRRLAERVKNRPSKVTGLGQNVAAYPKAQKNYHAASPADDKIKKGKGDKRPVTHQESIAHSKKKYGFKGDSVRDRRKTAAAVQLYKDTMNEK